MAPRSLVLPVIAILTLLSPGGAGAQPDAYESFLSRDAIGAAAFVRAHPDWDGRRVAIAVLDTGLDTAAPGLLTTPQGQPKIVEARDFTKQGDVDLRAARPETADGREVLRTDDGFVYKPTQHLGKARGGRCLLGFLDESRFANSAVSDINGNGREDDRFALLVCEGASTEGAAWFTVPDRDADLDLDEEAAVPDFSVAREAFRFAGADPQKGITPLAFAPTVRPEDRVLSLHFADGSHGTHVAGIAAGYRLGNREGYDGIAPGAQLLSLKIGDNTLAGGSTTSESMKKALEFAAEWAREHDTVVVANVSYGINSEREGRHDIADVVDQVVAGEPRLMVVSSAGNTGPGLSTVGTPADADLAFATAAVLTRENARDLYAVELPRDRLFGFSSRGGELAKPDAAAPGVAASAVPIWEGDNIFRGTSMASPQCAGAHALLASAAAQQTPPIAVHAGLMKRSLRSTARRLDGYLPLEQGGGLIQVEPAWRELVQRAKAGPGEATLGYRVSTAVPTQPGGEAPAAFWRVGGYVPAPPLEQTYEVRALLPQTWPAEKREAFLQTVTLRSDVPWLGVAQQRTFLRGENATRIAVRFRPEALRGLGLHNGRVVASDAGSGRPAFELMATVVVPERFDRAGDYRREWPREALGLAEVRRYFLHVPVGATLLDAQIAPLADAPAYVRLHLYDPSGLPFLGAPLVANSTRGEAAHIVIEKRDLRPGTWELVAEADYRGKRAAEYRLSVDFHAVDLGEPVFDHEPGEAPAGTVEVTNRFDQVFRGRVEAVVDGFERGREEDVDGDAYRYSFTLSPELPAVQFRLRMSPEDYARFTDIAVNILDAAGHAVEQTGFMGQLCDVAHRASGLAGPESFTLEVHAAHARKSDGSWSVGVRERFLHAAPIPVTVTADDAEEFALYPDTQRDLRLELARTPPAAPDGFQHHGTMQFLPLGDGPARPWHVGRFTFGPESLSLEAEP